MSTARVGVVLERSTPLDRPDDVIRLSGEIGDAWTAEPLAGFGTAIEVTTNDLIANYGVTAVERGKSESEAVRESVARHQAEAVAAYFRGRR